MDRRQLQQAVSEAQASIQMQAQQQLSERMHSICFKRCITAPTDKLADRQRRCLDQCLGAFQEGFGVAVRAAARAPRLRALVLSLPLTSPPPPGRPFTPLRRQRRCPPSSSARLQRAAASKGKAPFLVPKRGP